MKTEISRDSHQPDKRYSGVYQQQGRMLTDADWNELVDILKARLSEALKDVVGSKHGSGGGTPRHRALRIVDDGNIKIQPGFIYVDGMAASLPDTDPYTIDAQPDFPVSPVTAGDYVLYADVWERTVTYLMDPNLRDMGLHGADTCTRKQMLTQIKWCEKAINPEQSERNPGKGNARLSLTLLQKTAEPDTCDPCAAKLVIDTRVGNYLFRVEVHDVKGVANNPNEIILKWSSENGAEQFLALATEREMPGGFISDKWVYEFFDETTERHLGVHLVNSSVWQPSRAELKRFSATSGDYTVPTIPGSSEAKKYVRRWDGYCKIDLANGVVLECVDRGTDIVASGVSLGATIEIALNAINIELEIAGKSFVAGDYWLADVREAEHGEGSPLLTLCPPQGIDHHYLILGTVSGGNLVANTETDRKYAFPSLTEMTRLFMTGGDGQEVSPGNSLPQPLRVGVANGEWPVAGASVRFEIEEGGGNLALTSGGPTASMVTAKTNSTGIAECIWTPNAVLGEKPRVRATLVDPDAPTTLASDFSPPVYFYANLVSADQVAYTSKCEPNTNESTVHHLLLGPDRTRIGLDSYYTVEEVLDALLCELKANHIPYDDPGCTGNTVKNLLANLDFNGDSLLTVKDILDTLLCKLEAKYVPYDPNISDGVRERWFDIIDVGEVGSDFGKYLWSHNYQGTNSDFGTSIAVDAIGNVYLTGYFSGELDFGGNRMTAAGPSDLFIAKFNINGDHIWAHNYQGTGAEYGTSIAVDAAGNVCLTGYFSGELDFGGNRMTAAGSTDLFIAKFDTNGNHTWSHNYQGTNAEYGTSIAVDAASNVLLTGYFSGELDFGGNRMRAAGSTDLFIAKFNINGNHTWSHNYQGTGAEYGTSIAVDAVGNVHLTGYFSGVLDFGGDQMTAAGPADLFIAKFNSNGNNIWSHNYQGTSNEYGTSIIVDTAENVYLTGNFSGELDFGGNRMTATGPTDLYIAKFNSNGDHVWSHNYNGSSSDRGTSIAVDASDNVYLTGYFTGTLDFGGNPLTSIGPDDLFIAKFNINGDHIGSHNYQSTSFEHGNSIAVDGEGNVLLTGYFYGELDFGGNHMTAVGMDLFIAKLKGEQTLPNTVQAAIDTLAENLESSDINYKIPPCSGTLNSVRKLLPSTSTLPNGERLKINTLLDALLCELDASTIPYDRDGTTGTLIDGFLNKQGEQTITGPLIIDDGTATPVSTTLLDVRGTTETQGFKLTTGPQVDGYVLTLKSGLGEWSAPSAEGWRVKGTNVYAEVAGSQNVVVGIGTDTPVHGRLHVNGDIYTSGRISSNRFLADISNVTEVSDGDVLCFSGWQDMDTMNAQFTGTTYGNAMGVYADFKVDRVKITYVGAVNFRIKLVIDGQDIDQQSFTTPTSTSTEPVDVFYSNITLRGLAHIGSGTSHVVKVQWRLCGIIISQMKVEAGVKKRLIAFEI